MGERRNPFDMSLRLWSDDLSLRSILDDAGMVEKILYIRGESMAHTGALAGRIAPRHYASVANADGCNGADARSWLSATMDVVSRAGDLREGLRTKQIEGVLWIAILGRAALDMPTIVPALIAAAKALDLNIFLENYTRPEEADPFPEQLWLLERNPTVGEHRA